MRVRFEIHISNLAVTFTAILHGPKLSVILFLRIQHATSIVITLYPDMSLVYVEDRHHLQSISSDLPDRVEDLVQHLDWELPELKVELSVTKETSDGESEVDGWRVQTSWSRWV